MSFQQTGRSPFAGVRRPFEGSSDMMYAQFYQGVYLHASQASKYAQVPVQGRTHLIKPHNGPIPTAKIPPTSFTQKSSSGRIAETRPVPPVTKGPAENVQSEKTQPINSESNHPFRIDPRIHKLSDYIPRRPKHVPESLTTKEVKNKVVQSQLMKLDGGAKVISTLEAKARNFQIEVDTKMAEKYKAAQKSRMTKDDAIERALLNLLIEDPSKETVAVSDARERNEKRLKAMEDAKRQKKLHDTLSSYHSQYLKKYEKLKIAIASCQDMPKLLTQISDQLKILRANDPILASHVSKAKASCLSEKDVEMCLEMLQNIDAVNTLVLAEAEKINAGINEKERVANEAKKAEERVAIEAKKAEERVAIEAKKAEECVVIEAKKAEEAKESASKEEIYDISECCDAVFLPFYFDLREKYEKVRISLEPLVGDKKYEKFRFELQKSATTAVNSISRVSAKHMLDKYVSLRHLLLGNRAEGREFAANDHPLGPTYVRNVLAKVFVRQGDVAVSSRPDAAFEIASILVNLWVDFPDFGQLVHAHFLVVCPYLAPMIWPLVEGQQPVEHYRSLGYLIQNGAVEEQDLFLKRMKGIMRLYAAILITPTRSGAPNPLGMREAWRWLAAFCNLPPRPDISAVLVLELLQVAGHDLLKVYGMQAMRLLALVCKDYYPRLVAASVNGNKGALARLGSFLKKAMEEGTIPSPPQRLPAKFW